MTNFDPPLAPPLPALIDDLVRQRVDAQLAVLRGQDPYPGTEQNLPEGRAADQLTMIIFSGDLDKLLAAFTFATAAASMDLKVSMFFSFWGLIALKRRSTFRKKSVLSQIMTIMLPAVPGRTRTSRMNCFGVGPRLIKYRMRKSRVASLEDLIRVAQEQKVRMFACPSSMEVMGIDREELLEGVEYVGATSFLSLALGSKVTLFI